LVQERNVGSVGMEVAPDIMPKKLRIGVLGAANIARQFVEGVAVSSLVEVTAVASREAARGEEFARALGVGRHHGSYEALLEDPEIDAVYNPLPNSLHAEWSIRAAEMGKHVLCEKPFCLNAVEAKAMLAAAALHGVHVVEAYPYLAQMQTVRLRELLRAGTIGQVRHIQASFGFTVAGQGNIRMVAELGGGARLDAGSYPVSLVRVIAGERPARVHSNTRWFSDGVENTVAATLEFANGMVAQVFCSFATASHRHALISGDRGAIITDFLNHAPPDGKLYLQVKQGRESMVPFVRLELPAVNGFLAEAESFSQLVAGRPELWTGVTPSETTDILLTLDAINQSALSGGWVDVSS
jgi:D-xylose 1-dehydrogenase (NADP+, D-xylono-1,5-lactone-forming)